MYRRRSEEEIAEVKRLYCAGVATLDEIAVRFGYSRSSAISSLAKKRKWPARKPHTISKFRLYDPPTGGGTAGASYRSANIIKKRKDQEREREKEKQAQVWPAVDSTGKRTLFTRLAALHRRMDQVLMETRSAP